MKEAFHWADGAAERIIREKRNKKKYVCAAGITPSGIVHIGNFREIITVDLVSRALQKKGKEVRFIYSWDDYDVFRKVPKGLPKQEMLKKNLRKPIVDIPDPYGTSKSYAKHFEKEVEEDIKKLGIKPKFIYQADMYRGLKYKEGIKKAIENVDKIKSILNKYRKEPLKENWLPVTLFDPDSGTDEFTDLKYLGDSKLSYKDKKGKLKEFDFSKDGRASLLWRVDWPMRWDYEKVDFEPGGKDHSTIGGSYSTGKEIVKEVYNFEAPSYVMYDFVKIKGAGGKISSSLGNVITLGDCLEIYEPEIIRWLFASTKPNKEFSISFDLDVIKNYEEFDKLERNYFENKLDKKQKRIYELSCVDKIPEKLPEKIGFRHLTTLVQLPDFKPKNKIIEKRALLIKNWLNKYAPEDMKFTLQKKPLAKFNKKEKEVLKLLANKLKSGKYDENSLFEEFYNISKETNTESKEFFKIVYRLLINKEKGPKLAPFIIMIGPKKVTNLIEKIQP